MSSNESKNVVASATENLVEMTLRRRVRNQ
ncbi:unnamed protein product [Dibothriocephalus latus]|uniref:Uncharacterized protein n=1 Tax=Dibothriocephalus latus TaxID=60516 RepID=A0A3P7LKA3_DIBLA|nr:unnamed protein product [Dibothriocephalus latus]